MASYEEEEEEEPRRRSKCDAAVGFTDSRGVFFAADQRMAAAQRVVDHMAGQDEMLRQRYRDGRAEINKARAEMIRDRHQAATLATRCCLPLFRRRRGHRVHHQRRKRNATAAW